MKTHGYPEDERDLECCRRGPRPAACRGLRAHGTRSRRGDEHPTSDQRHRYQRFPVPGGSHQRMQRDHAHQPLADHRGPLPEGFPPEQPLQPSGAPRLANQDRGRDHLPRQLQPGGAGTQCDRGRSGHGPAGQPLHDPGIAQPAHARLPYLRQALRSAGHPRDLHGVRSQLARRSGRHRPEDFQPHNGGVLFGPQYRQSPVHGLAQRPGPGPLHQGLRRALLHQDVAVQHRGRVDPLRSRRVLHLRGRQTHPQVGGQHPDGKGDCQRSQRPGAGCARPQQGTQRQNPAVPTQRRRPPALAPQLPGRGHRASPQRQQQQVPDRAR